MPTLVKFVHNLPTEIFDEIKALTFIVDGDDVVEITKAYKPPPQLQIDRASRDAFAQEYYATKTFLLPSPSDPLSIKWFGSLDLKSSAPIKKLRFPVCRKCSWIDGFFTLSFCPSPFHGLSRSELYCRITIRGVKGDLQLEEDGNGFWTSELADLRLEGPSSL